MLYFLLVTFAYGLCSYALMATAADESDSQ